MKLFNRLIRILEIIFYLISFQINVINCQQYVPRAFHTATLVGKKIFFLGGFTESPKSSFTNDFFTLDVSKSFNQSEGFPFEDLSKLSTKIPEHNRASTSVANDTFFLFGGHMGNHSDYVSEILHSFNTSNQVWQQVTMNSGEEPLRRTSMSAVTDKNGTVYLFSGAKEYKHKPIQYYNKTNTFNTVNNTWDSINLAVFVLPRDGYTATFIPEDNVIFYIGGFGKSSDPFTTEGLIDIGNLDIYDTINNNWSNMSTSDPPSSRVFHTAVLTKDRRIILFGGADNTTAEHPARTYYEVLDTKTYQWHHNNKGISLSAPYKGHTATLVDDYMFIAFGYVRTKDGDDFSDGILIYKIGDNANFDQVDNFNPSTSETTPQETTSPDIKRLEQLIIILASIIGILGLIIIIMAAYIIYKRYRIL